MYSCSKISSKYISQQEKSELNVVKPDGDGENKVSMRSSALGFKIYKTDVATRNYAKN
jgi:hypothetical protein